MDYHNSEVTEMLERARLLEDLGDLQQAARLLERAIPLAPADWRVPVRLGAIYYELEQLGAAAASYRAALRLKPESAGIRSNLASVLVDLDQLSEAESLYDQAITIEPTAPRLVLLGNVQLSRGHLREAEETFRRGLTLEPDNEEAAYNLAILIRTKKWDEAVSLLRQAVKCDPSFQAAFRELGFTLAGRDPLDEAERFLRTAIRMDPEDAAAHLYLANVLGRIGKSSEALSELMTAEACAPLWALPKKLLGDTLATDDPVAAERWFRAAIQADSTYVPAMIGLAKVLLLSSRKEEAAPILQRIVEIDPSSPEARELLRRLKAS